MNAWEDQQRALKGQERKAKLEATAALQSYRRLGLTEEEIKLATLREENRVQKQSAAEQLRGYRGQLSEEEARLAAQRQEELRQKQSLEEQLRTNGVISAHDLVAHQESIRLMKDSGAVSELAAGYASPSVPQLPASSFGSSRSMVVPAHPNFSPDAPDAVAPSYGYDAAASQFASTTDSRSAGETVPSPNEPAPMPAPIYSPTTSTTSFKSKAMFMFGILTAADVDTASHEERSRLVSRYLARADEIARLAIAESPSCQSILPSLIYPVASAIEKDHCKYCIVLYCSILTQLNTAGPWQAFVCTRGMQCSSLDVLVVLHCCLALFPRRSSSIYSNSFHSTPLYMLARTDAHRTRVTVTISFSAPDEATARSFQSQIIGRVRNAISDGSFTRQ